MFLFGRRKLLVFLTFVTLSLLAVTVNHYLSTTAQSRLVDYFDAVSVDQQQGANSWRVITHEVSDENKHSSFSDSKGAKMEAKRVDFIRKTPAAGKYEQQQVMAGNTIRPQALTATQSAASDGGTRFIPQHRVVHLDLKGAPPKLTFLKSIFPLIKEAGATAVLLEYEDMFPFWGALRNVSAKNSYSVADVQNIQAWAAENDLIVIPLIQTFGHLEFVLKLKEFVDLREVPIYPQALCPSQDQGWLLVKTMIDQVLSLHPDAGWLHIGCDEVFQLGQCSKCSERLSKANSENENLFHDSKSLFLEHVFKVATYVREEKHVIPIIWDDMLRNIPAQALTQSGIGPLVEPMVWVYVEDIDRFVDSITWSAYGAVFQHLWTASAFKGAFGERMFAVNVQRHVANHLSWLEVMRRETHGSNSLSFRGILLTGWSRYDHFAVLCELLPVAIPSLVLNLAILSRGGQDFESIRRTHRILQCGSQKSLMTPEELRRNPLQWDLHRCHFSGSGLLALMNTYNMNRKELEAAYERIDVKDGWMTQYNTDHKFSSPWRVHEVMRSISYLPGSLKILEAQFEKALSSFFDEFTVSEWVEQHIRPLLLKLDELNKRANVLTAAMSWPRRPLVAVQPPNEQQSVTLRMSDSQP